MKLSLALSGLLAVGLTAAAHAAPPAGPTLSAAEVKSLIVGHAVSSDGGPPNGMTWYYKKDGSFDGDDGRIASAGRYTVTPDGRLCWKKTDGISGCFVYYRQGKTLRARRAEKGAEYDLGVITTGPL